jgi:hypothetical protein
MNQRLPLIFALASSLLGCQWWMEPLPDPDCSNAPVDLSRELVLSDAELRTDARALNAQRGVFSFAGQIAALESRYAGLDLSRLWAIIGQPAARGDGSLPFRLLALVNRSDLAEQLAPLSPAGEGRLVYTLTDGPGDDARVPALPLTVIFEYSLGSERSAKDWAIEFHTLGQTAWSRPNEHMDAIAAIAQSFVSSEATSTAPRLSQIRVNDGRVAPGRMYELALDEHGVLVARGLRNTPRIELAASPALLSFASDHAEAIASGAQQIPEPWLALSASIEPVDWLPNSRLERDFSRGTCSGCHGTDGPGQDGFHVQEGPDGSVRLSDFMSGEELPRRVRVMRERLCSD